MKPPNLPKEKLFQIFFFILVLGIGLLVFKDFGVHYDEKCLIDIGIHNYRYINQGDQALLTFQDRYYGPFFELPLLILTNNIPTPGMIYFRHFAVFLTFFTGLIGLYYLGSRLFHDSRWELLPVVLMVTSPRLFSDSFYNSKDIPFMVFILFGIVGLVRWLDLLDLPVPSRSLYSIAVLQAVITAAATTTRTPGIMLLGLTSIFVLGKMAIQKRQFKKVLISILIFLFFTIGLIILFMPILWHDPLRGFIAAFKQISHFNLWMVHVLFNGESIQANNVGWSYFPIWFCITTPYLVLVGLISGFICLIISGVKKVVYIASMETNRIINRFNTDFIIWMVISAWFVVPVIALFVFQSVLYDAWRQMFFLYPAILLLAVCGMRKVYDWTITRTANKVLINGVFGIILTAGLIEPVAFMVKYHPHENVYFNQLAGDPLTLRQRFDLDYWGLSYKQGIDYILASDSRDHILLSAVGPASLYVEYMLPHEQADRLSFTELEQADYFLTNYRWHPDDFPYPDKYFSIFVRGTEIMTVYRLREPVGKYGN